MRAPKIEWTPTLTALVQGWAGRIVAGLDEGLSYARAQGLPAVSGDVCAWCIVRDGQPPGLYLSLREQAAEKLRGGNLPQAAEWIAVLGQPAPPEHIWLFITNDGPGALLEPYPVAALRRTRADA